MSLIDMLLYTVKGVAQATAAQDSAVEAAIYHVSSSKLAWADVQAKSLDGWLHALAEMPGQADENALHIVKIAVIITYIRYKSLYVDSSGMSGKELDIAWDMICAAILGSLYTEKRAIRGHQGFLNVAICDLRTPNGDNEEMWRVHLWLPYRPSPGADFLIHSHKSFGQSWVLAGEGVNGDHEVEYIDDRAAATHAIFKLENQKTISHLDLSTTSVNTEQYVQVKNSKYETHTRGMSYTVPATAFHTSQVPLEKVHATLFCFDASRGYSNDGGVMLGPKDLPRVHQDRNPGGFKASTLASVIESVRRWEIALEEALSCSQKGAWPEAKAAFERMETEWRPIPDAAPGIRISSPLNDLQNLNIYRDLAQTLVAWVENVVQARERLGDSDEAGAEKYFDIAREKCGVMSDISIAKQCEAIMTACR